MSVFRRQRGDHALVDGAWVPCPLQGVDVLIEECLTCGKLRNVVEDDLPYVICAGRRTDLRADSEM